MSDDVTRHDHAATADDDGYDGYDRRESYDGQHAAAAPTATPRLTRGVGTPRHALSVVIALLAVPAAYVGLDYAGTDALARSQAVDPDGLPIRTTVVLLVSAGLFLLAALAGRLSAIGPLVAGIVWGALPLLWVLLDFESFARRCFDLADAVEPYDRFMFGVVGFAYYVFPVVAGLLVGLGIAGRWRRPNVL